MLQRNHFHERQADHTKNNEDNKRRHSKNQLMMLRKNIARIPNCISREKRIMATGLLSWSPRGATTWVSSSTLAAAATLAVGNFSRKSQSTLSILHRDGGERAGAGLKLVLQCNNSRPPLSPIATFACAMYVYENQSMVTNLGSGGLI